MAVLPVFLVLVIVGGEAFEQLFHAVRLVVGHGGVVAVVHGQVLDLHAETTGATLGAAVLKELEQTLDVLGVRLGEQMRVTDSGSNHALYRIRAGRRACPKARNTLYEKPIAGSGPVSRSRDSPQSLRDSSPHRGELKCMRVQSAEVKPCGSPASANLAL